MNRHGRYVLASAALFTAAYITATLLLTMLGVPTALSPRTTRPVAWRRAGSPTDTRREPGHHRKRDRTPRQEEITNALSRIHSPGTSPSPPTGVHDRRPQGDPRGGAVSGDVLQRAAQRIRHDIDFGQQYGDPEFLTAVAAWLDIATLTHPVEAAAAAAVASAYLAEASR